MYVSICNVFKLSCVHVESCQFVTAPMMKVQQKPLILVWLKNSDQQVQRIAKHRPITGL